MNEHESSSFKRGPWFTTTLIAAGVSLVVGFAGGVAGSQLVLQRQAVQSSQSSVALLSPQPPTSGDDKRALEVPAGAQGEEDAAIAVAKSANQAVVSVVVSKVIPQTPAFNPNDFFFNFGFPFDFPEVQPQTPSTKGQPQVVGGGSGFIVRSNGLIATNKHVVADADATYTVRLSTGKEYPAKIVATDPVNDIGFLKIEATNLPTLPLGDSNKLQIGQTVLAIGYSLGEYLNSVTKGVISGISRDIVAGDNGSGNSERLEGVIQTDAAINPGNSGGPLLNLKGQAIGINTAIDRQGQLVGFAIPINVVASAISSVEKSGKVVRPYLGVRYVELDSNFVKEKNLSVNSGAYVVSQGKEPAVMVGSPADKAGLKEGDVITKVNGQALGDQLSLSQTISRLGVGETVRLTVVREGKTLSVDVKLEERPSG
jgi:serine protease Do